VFAWFVCVSVCLSAGLLEELWMNCYDCLEGDRPRDEKQPLVAEIWIL